MSLFQESCISDLHTLMRQQVEYYTQIALTGQYDRAYARIGRYDRGEQANAQWRQELTLVEHYLAAFAPRGDVLELACGNGRWTGQIARNARTVTALDASPAMLQQNRQRVNDSRVSYILADLFTWEPGRRFDCIIFCLWLSHVPPQWFETFWQRIAAWLLPGGRVFFMDSLYDPERTALDEDLSGREATTLVRKLDNGQTCRILKVFYDPADLQQALLRLHWQAKLVTTGRYFYCGEASRVNPAVDRLEETKQ
jgi:ubiquinone/menaquinone biosynthesis C-methylase UbiE